MAAVTAVAVRAFPSASLTEQDVTVQFGHWGLPRSPKAAKAAGAADRVTEAPRGKVIIIGGGLAGLAAAAALGSAGFEIDLLESRPFLGGRASSYPLPGGESDQLIDNCQHILLRCCTNLLDLYERLRVRHLIRFHREFFFIEPGGRMSSLRAGRLPAPLHFTGSFARLTCLSAADKLSIARAMFVLRSERTRRSDLDRITMLDWLREKRQTARAVDRFWRQVLVSAINEDLDRMAAAHGFEVFWTGFLASRNSYEMGVPAAPLGELYSSDAWKRMPNVRIHLRHPVDRVVVEHGNVCGVVARDRKWDAPVVVLTVPYERSAELCPEAGLRFDGWEHSPITGIHLWFDREVTTLPHATLLDRTIQWFFNKAEGRYLEIVVSASRSLLEMPAPDVTALAVRELAEFLPKVNDAKLTRSLVIKEARATFSAKPGMNSARPETRTQIGGLYLAGDWTRTEWPATMEGAVRSGYLAAEAITEALGSKQRFCL
jgi:zeta-carotene desaturase